MKTIGKILTSLLLLTFFTANSALAELIVGVVNESPKAIHFSLMVPRSKTYSQLEDGHVPAHAWKVFSSNALIPKCQGKGSWRCSKLRVVVQEWGHYGVFVQCPKAYSSRYRTRRQWVKVTGNDSAHLKCRLTKAPKQQNA